MARTAQRTIWTTASLALAVLTGCHSPTFGLWRRERPGALIVDLAPEQRGATRSVLYLEREVDPQPRDRGPELVEVTSRGPSFDPPLRVVQSGTDIRFVNRGGLAHRLFIADDSGRRERAVDPGGTSEPLRIGHVGQHRFYCSLHPDESFAVFASPSDHFVVPDGGRSLRIDDLSPGHYRLSWWSDAGIRSVGAVEIRPGETARRTISSELDSK